MQLDQDTTIQDANDPIITTRPARAGDTFALLQMLRELAVSHGMQAHLGMDELTRDCFGPDRTLALHVAEDDNGRIIGFAGMQRMARSTARGADLQQLFIKEDARGTGACEALIDAIETESRLQGAVYLRVAGSLDTIENMGLYRRPAASAAAQYSPLYQLRR